MREHRAITLLIDLQSPQFALLAPGYRSSARLNGWLRQFPNHQVPGPMLPTTWAALQSQIDQKGYAAFAGALPAMEGQFYVVSTLPGSLRTPTLDCPVCGGMITHCFKRSCRRIFCQGGEQVVETRKGKAWVLTCPKGHERRDEDVPFHLTDEYKEALVWKKSVRTAPDWSCTAAACFDKLK